MDGVLAACDVDCGADLPDCAGTYTAGAIAGYADCGGGATTCSVAYNSTVNTCSEICAAAGGECFLAYNNGYGACDFSDEQIDCDFDTYTSAICICSRGCGGGDLCAGGDTCTDGVCL
jgi:hypothetical protein